MKMEMRAFVRLALAAMACAMLLALPNAAQAWTFKVIHNFCSLRNCEDGADPGAGLLMDSAGNLYGTSESANGNDAGGVYELVPNADHSRWKHRTLYKFSGTDGRDPRAELIIDAAGNLYGTTEGGGAQGGGTAFELLPGGNHATRVIKLLHSFNGTDGNAPVAPLSYDGAASGIPYDGTSELYGTTLFGGNACSFLTCGVVFGLSPSGSDWTETTIYKFCQSATCPDGFFPQSAPLVQGGQVFVTAARGGNPEKKDWHGTVLQLAGSSATVLHIFCKVYRHCSDGGFPLGLTPDGSGALFGIGQAGGAHDKGCCGVVFKLVPSGTASEYTVLHQFCDLRDCKDGAQPRSNLLIDTSGNVWGATNTGGGHDSDSYNYGGGTVFKLTGTTLETLHAFCSERDCADGEYPIGNLAMDSAGNIFGVTQGGGKFRRGVVYEISP